MDNKCRAPSRSLTVQLLTLTGCPPDVIIALVMAKSTSDDPPFLDHRGTMPHITRRAKLGMVQTLVAITLAALTLLAPLSAPSTDVEGQTINLLLNPGFEDGFSERGAGEVTVANGWFPWTCAISAGNCCWRSRTA